MSPRLDETSKMRDEPVRGWLDEKLKMRDEPVRGRLDEKLWVHAKHCISVPETV